MRINKCIDDQLDKAFLSMRNTCVFFDPMKSTYNIKLKRGDLLKWKAICVFLLLIFLSSFQVGFSQFRVNVSTTAAPPYNPLIEDYILSGNIRSTLNANSTTDVYLFGRIERISSPTFSITANTLIYYGAVTIPPLRLVQGVPFQITPSRMMASFGNFEDRYVVTENIDLNSLRVGNKLTLPPGTYRICFIPTNTDFQPVAAPGSGCATFTIAPPNPDNAVTINTQLIPPANPDIVGSIFQGKIKPVLLFNNPRAQQVNVKVFGKLESLAPKPFTIALNPDYFQQPSIALSHSIPVQMTPQQVRDAFGNFQPDALITTGISLDELRDDKNILKLPEGVYKICFYARYDSFGLRGGYASNVNLGCATFNICYKAAAPQLTQPVTGFDIRGHIPKLTPKSPVIFSWTPVNATCGVNLSRITYDFEIREMFEGQVPTDAINNPPVYQKSGLRTPSFVFDTMLNKQVLQRGKSYVIRVKANVAAKAEIEIDNNGYSRVEAFVYGENESAKEDTRSPSEPSKSSASSIPTSKLKGKVVWSFKKSEEDQQDLEKSFIKVSDNPIIRQVLTIATRESQKSASPSEKKEAEMISIDPNLQSAISKTVAASILMQPQPKKSNSGTPVFATVTGEGDLFEAVGFTSGNEKGKVVHPLKGATVFLMGVKAKNQQDIGTGSLSAIQSGNLSKQLGIVAQHTNKFQFANSIIETAVPEKFLFAEDQNQEEDILASGYSDENGNFIFRFIDPKFKNSRAYSKMRVEVKHRDFESYSQYIDIVAPDENGDVDLGTLHLLAKSWRFTPYMQERLYSANIELYCPADAIKQNPHYAFMGKQDAARSVSTIAGREYVKIADLNGGETAYRLFYLSGSGGLVIRISQKEREDYLDYIGVIPKMYSFPASSSPGGTFQPLTVDESDMIISVKKQYTLTKILPFITGNTKISLGDAGIGYGVGALVTVSFDKNKVVEKYSPAQLKPQSNEMQESGNSNAKIKSSVTREANVQSQVVKRSNEVTRAIKTEVKNTGTTQGTIVQLAENSVLPVAKKADAVFLSSFLLTAYQTRVDEDGNFRIDNLPVLAEGSFFTVTVETEDGLMEKKVTTKTLKRGESEDLPFQFNPEIFTVTGRVLDENNKPIEGASLSWKSGGDIVESGKEGLFTVKNYKDDYLNITAMGYVQKSVFVKLNKQTSSKEEPKKDTKKNNKTKNPVITEPALIDISSVAYSEPQMKKWAATMATQPSVKAAFQKSSSNPVSIAESEIQVISSLSSMYKELFSAIERMSGVQDIGNIKLEKGAAKVNFVVKDEDGKPVSGATIHIESMRDTVTDKSGEVVIKGNGNQFTYVVSGPESETFVSQSGTVSQMVPDGSTTLVNVVLKKGVMLSGKVLSGQRAIDDAEIYVEGSDFIKAQSKSDGSYSLVIPKGYSKVFATKSNYRGSVYEKNFTASTTHDFVLEDGGGRNISKLLGFDIVLESYQKEGASAEIWSGAFVNLNANSIFSATGSARLNFSNIKVTFDPDGNAQVLNNEVKTDVTELPIKLLGYLPVRMKGAPVLTVKKNADGKGTINGKLQLDPGQISSLGGLNIGTDFLPLLTPANQSVDQEVAVFVSDGSVGLADFVFSFARAELKSAADKAVAELKKKADKATGEAKKMLDTKLNELKSAAASAAGYVTSGNIPQSLPQYLSVSVLGFEGMVDLSKSKISGEGINFSGLILTPEMPVISSLLFDIDQLAVSNDFTVRNVSLSISKGFRFDIGGWGGELNSANLSRSGFKVGGKIKVKAPKSKEADLEFSNLAIGTGGIYGGSFSLPSSGLDIFEVVNLKTGSTPLSFGRVGNTSVYKLGGSASFSFGKLFKDQIQLPYFQIQTDGKFAATVPVNKSLNAGFAKFALDAIGFDATKAVPQIDITGQFSIDVKMVSFKTAGIHFTKDGVRAERISLAVDIPAVNVEAFVDLKDNGFSGGGSLSILSTPVKAGVSFFYFKEPSGIRLGADFSANVKIPLGPVIISRVGGGFTYSPNSDYFRVTISGGASVTGLETLVALDPIELTVESGPKITGKVGIKVASAFEMANAFIVLDIPNSYFTVGIRSNYSPLPDIMNTNIQGDLVVSTKPGDTYFFLGAGMDVNLLGIIRSRGVYALGFGVKNARDRETISYYLSDAPADYLSSGSFTGIYVKGSSYMGIPRERAMRLDLGIVWGEAWFESGSDFYFIANFNNLNFKVSSSMFFGGGVKGCVGVRVLGEEISACASAEARACVLIEGGFSSNLGWNFNAAASGEGVLSIGDNCDCNSICGGAFYVGGKVCVGLGARISYASRQGGLRDFSIVRANRVKCQ